MTDHVKAARRSHVTGVASLTNVTSAESARFYEALVSGDARFDGRFFVGVSSTGIYCRPVCRARKPRRDNCICYASAAAAEGAGFRPCLRCRPELAPGSAPVDASSRLAHRAAMALQSIDETDGGMNAVAARLSVTSRHLRRVFATEFGVSPVAFLQTQRLLTAKRLLTDTEMTVVGVALTSGFSSLRRFNAVFRERYRMNPSDMRKGRTPPNSTHGFRFALAFRPPYDVTRMLAFLRLRAIPGVESVDETTYRRIVALSVRGARFQGWISARFSPSTPALEVVVSPSLVGVLPQVLARLSHLFDLGGQPAEVSEGLGALAEPRPGLRVPGAMNGFELAVRAVLGQQITVKAARTLAWRIVEAFGDRVPSPFEGLDKAFPAPEQIAQVTSAELGALGILRTRSATLQALARGVVDQSLRLEADVDVEETIQALMRLPGIGEWTAQYIAMRALAWPDAFLRTDHGVRMALPGLEASKIKARADAWRPWRSYAVMHLWASLEKI